MRNKNKPIAITPNGYCVYELRTRMCKRCFKQFKGARYAKYCENCKKKTGYKKEAKGK